MQTKNMPILLNQKELLEVLKIGRSTLSRLRSKDNFPEPINGRPLRWRHDDIYNYLKAE